MEEWLYYNFAAGSFHTKKLCSRLYSMEIEFYFFKQLFEPPFGGLRGNICTPSIVCWKAHGQLPIHRDWAFSPISWDVISGNLSKLAFFEGSGSLKVQISDGREHHPPTTVHVRKLEWLLFHVVSKYPQRIVWFCHKACIWQMDKQTNRIMTANTTLDSCSHSKNRYAQNTGSRNDNDISNTCISNCLTAVECIRRNWLNCPWGRSSTSDVCVRPGLLAKNLHHFTCVYMIFTTYHCSVELYSECGNLDCYVEQN